MTVGSDVLHPERAHAATIVWLCGIGQRPDDWRSFAASLNLREQGIRHVFPHPGAQYVSRFGGGTMVRAWFNKSLAGSADADVAQLDASVLSLHELLAAEADEVGAKRLFLAGFSQGGAMALIAGLRYPERLAGIMLYAAYWVKAANLRRTMSPSSKGVPIWAGHGRRDLVVPARTGRRMRWVLNRLGYEVSWHLYPGGHEPFAGAAGDIRHFLDDVLDHGVSR